MAALDPALTEAGDGEAASGPDGRVAGRGQVADRADHVAAAQQHIAGGGAQRRSLQ